MLGSSRLTAAVSTLREGRGFIRAAEHETLGVDEILDRIAAGTMVAIGNRATDDRDDMTSCLIGSGARKKICALVGLGPKETDPDVVLSSIQVILAARPDVIMELSTNDSAHEVRRVLKDVSPVPIGGCATYDLFREFKQPLSRDEFIERFAVSMGAGIDFVLLHAGVDERMLATMATSKRVMPTTSRGGGLVSRYMKVHGRENPIIEFFDDLCEILAETRVVLDLGDIFRPGCLADAGDGLKRAELELLAGLRQRAMDNGVQVLCESGGHMPLDKIPEILAEYRSIVGGAPLWLAGPMVVDTGVTLDATVNALGVAAAAQCDGGDLFASITDNEHYAMPTSPETAQSVRQLRVVIEAVEYASGLPTVVERNLEMSRARRENAWSEQARHSIYPDLSNQVFMQEGLLRDGQPCTICGKYCPHIVVTKAGERSESVKQAYIR